MKQSKILQELRSMNARHLQESMAMLNLGQEKLSAKPSAERWNAFECIDHLCSYGDIYVKEFKRVLEDPNPRTKDEFKPGILGSRSAKSMLPDAQGKPNNPMKTFKKMDPSGKTLNKGIIEHFIRLCTEMEKILDQAEKADLNKNRCRLTLPLLKFKLGDTLQFHLFHNERHMTQVKRALKA